MAKLKFEQIPSEKAKDIILAKLKKALTLDTSNQKEVLQKIVDDEEFRQYVNEIQRKILTKQEPAS
ncbi:MAG: hypothetical protein ABIM99_01400 [Candidatus Dojkabacteria bacterium]